MYVTCNFFFNYKFQKLSRWSLDVSTKIIFIILMSVLKTAAIHPPPSPAACPVSLCVGSRVQWGGSVLPLQQQRAACGCPARVWVREDPAPAPRLLGHATVPPWVSFPHLPVEAHDSPGTLGLCWNVPLVWGNLFKSERGHEPSVR